MNQSEDSKEHDRGPDEHPLLEMATVLGGVVGGVVGAAGGPPGIAAGAAMGTAMGMAAGAALDREDARSEEHQRELDAAGDFLPMASLLRADHARLETYYAALVNAYESGDWSTAQREWERFETALRDHMAREEDRVFPTFIEIEPEEATALLTEHSELRRLLSNLGVCIELHAVHIHAVQELLTRLRAHSERENRILYPWVARTSGP